MVIVRVTVLGPIPRGRLTTSSVSSSFEEKGNEEVTAVADAGMGVGVEDADVAMGTASA